jgi:hypothetical protein
MARVVQSSPPPLSGHDGGCVGDSPSRSEDAPAAAGAQQGGRGRLRVEMAAAHTSPAFGVAYQAAGMAAPEAMILRLPGVGRGGGGGGGGDGGGGAALQGAVAAEGPRGGGAARADAARQAKVASFEFACCWELPVDEGHPT